MQQHTVWVIGFIVFLSIYFFVEWLRDKEFQESCDKLYWEMNIEVFTNARMGDDYLFLKMLVNLRCKSRYGFTKNDKGTYEPA